MLERGSYIPWGSRFKQFLNCKRENRKWLLKALEDGPYVFRNITPTGSTIPRLQEVEDLQGDDLLYYDAEMELMNMILLSIPNEIYNSVDSYYFEQKSSDTTINSAAQPTHDQEDSPSTSSIIVDTHEAPPIVTTSDEQTSPISLQESDEFNQEYSANFDGNTQFVPYDSLNHEEIESSTMNLEPSNV
ncbi:hypothetical protein Tco_0159748 [Tanacetum coccineum]